VPAKVYVNVTVIPGDCVPLIAQKLATAKVCSEADFLAAVNTYPFTEASFGQIPYDPATICYRLEGYLYPDTYQFYVNMKPQDAIGMMLRNADTNIVNKGYSYQTVILASIIQKEANDVDIMKNVSSVFHNRLNDTKDYPYLGSDATTFYLTKYIQSIDTAFGSDLVDKYKIYYNTKQVNGEARRHGLPIGPICSPYANALDAAAHPADTPYLNFYSDATGYHFS
jgi:UPF0755 protein